MKINDSSLNNKFTLNAVDINHNIEGFEDIKKPYTIFNSTMNNYHMVLDKNNKPSGDEIFRSISTFIKNNKTKGFDIDLDSFFGFDKGCKSCHSSIAYSVISGAEYGSVIPWSAKKSDQETKLGTQNILTKEIDLANEILVVSQAQTIARKLQDTPSNLMRPGDFEAAAKELFKGLDVSIKVIYQDELIKKGMNLLNAVGMGTENKDETPRLLVVEYNNNKDSNTRYGLVGKGVCFDSGGYNIKVANHMRWMKYDMSGAAIMLCTIYALAKNNIKTNVVGLMPLVLNLVSAKAQRPDDVLTSYLGKTVEIDNTDAEGRLILADAITYAAKDLKVDKIFETSTLTGAMVYSLGETYTGCWTTDDETWDEITQATRYTGELVWRLPFHHDFIDLLKSNYADLANSVSDPRGGSSRAAAFLKEFTCGTTFSHFDIAATGDKGNSGTGIMLKTFYNIVKNIK